jgi:hypothetical protein
MLPTSPGPREFALPALAPSIRRLACLLVLKENLIFSPSDNLVRSTKLLVRQVDLPMARSTHGEAASNVFGVQPILWIDSGWSFQLEQKAVTTAAALSNPPDRYRLVKIKFF